MKTISLNNGVSVKVDDNLYDRLKLHHWYLLNGYPAARIGDKQIYMHIMVLDMNYTDHINRDPLDNRLENLRIVSNQHNCMNRGLNKNNTSGYKGVSWHKKTGKWSVGIYYNYKRIYIGLFKNIKNAAKAYNDKAVELYGDYAWVNSLD